MLILTPPSFFLTVPPPPRSTLFPYTTLFRSVPPKRNVSAPPMVQSTTMKVAAESSAEVTRSEEHTSELQSRQYLVCRLLLEKKKKTKAETTEVADLTRSSGDRETKPSPNAVR